MNRHQADLLERDNPRHDNYQELFYLALAHLQKVVCGNRRAPRLAEGPTHSQKLHVAEALPDLLLRHGKAMLVGSKNSRQADLIL